MAIAVDRADIERLVSRRRLHALVLKGRSPPTRLAFVAPTRPTLAELEPDGSA